VPVPKPEPLPSFYLERYYHNFMRRGRGMKPDTSIRGNCVSCGEDGVLAYDLLHRGEARSTNLLCHDCCEEE
jgi:hypothetical protein